MPDRDQLSLVWHESSTLLYKGVVPRLLWCHPLPFLFHRKPSFKTYLGICCFSHSTSSTTVSVDHLLPFDILAVYFLSFVVNVTKL